MELKYITTPEQYKKYVKDFTRKRFIRISLLGTVVILAFSLIVAITSDSGWITYPVLFVLAIFYFALLFFTLRFRQARALKKNIQTFGEGYFDHPKTITLNNEKLEIESFNRSIAVPYRGIEKVSEDPSGISIKFKAGDMVYIPKEGILNPENTQEFIASLNSKINELHCGLDHSS